MTFVFTLVTTNGGRFCVSDGRRFTCSSDRQVFRIVKSNGTASGENLVQVSRERNSVVRSKLYFKSSCLTLTEIHQG